VLSLEYHPHGCSIIAEPRAIASRLTTIYDTAFPPKDDVTGIFMLWFLVMTVRDDDAFIAAGAGAERGKVHQALES